MRRLLYFSLLIAHCTFSFASGKAHQPWTFWYWMYGAVSEDGIKADLQAMKDVGLGGCYLMPIRGAAERPEYNGQADALTPNFWHMIDYALQQADSLGLDMGIHVCDGFALAGGPWITPKESMQKVVFCDTIVNGGKHHLQMAKPLHYGTYYEDIAAYAIPVPAAAASTTAPATVPDAPASAPYAPATVPDAPATVPDAPATVPDAPATVPDGFPSVPAALPSGALSFSSEVTINPKGVYCADAPCWLQYSFDSPTLVRHIEIEPSGTNIQCQRLNVKASDDGVVFYHVKQLTPPRQGWQNTGYNTTFSIPPTKARYFRFEWTPEGTEPGAEDLDAAKWKPVFRLKSLRLGSFPLIDNWEGKAGYVWRIAPDTPEADLAKDDFLHPGDIVMGKMQGDILDINLPKGTWRILRFGHTSTGHTNATAGGAKGLECDKFSAAAVSKQVDGWFGLFMQRPNHRAIKYLHVDSWECGSQNWSDNFADEFRQRRGYDLLPFLPVYAGVPMQNGEQVLRDIRKTINDLVNEVFFTTVARKAKEYGVQLSSESVAPTMVSDGMEHYKYADVPMGEYWLNSPTHDKPNDMLDAISGAHVYGKTIVQAEGFTEVRGVWDETPASIKTLLDRNFALGMNRLFFHVNTHNPWLDRKPGMTLDGIGLFFQRDQTWFPEAKAFVDYITRCQKLLQEGQPVADIAVYTGEEMPRRAFTPDRLVPMLPGLFGPERVASERERLANHGQPMEESPVGVRHAAGILDLKNWINPLHGYQYDSMNKDALLHQPFNYRVLVVPEWLQVSPEAQSRIEQLRQQGVQVIDKPYTQPTIAGIAPDITLPDGIAYTHRTTGQKDIYFLSNQTDAAVSFQPTFRHSDCQQPVIYRPLTDEPEPYEKGTIQMTAHEALFVIFDQQTTPFPRPVTTCLHHRPPKEKLSWKLDKGWTMTFKESGLVLRSDTLFDWSRHQDDKIRYFSGHVSYATSFKYKGNTRVMLCLGEVHDIAHIWVNDIDCGIVWTAPYEVDITKALKKGKNKLVIEVVNTWHNALRGADQGKAPYDGIWTNAKYRTKGDGLLPAGLLTPPTLKTKKNMFF